jgi:hypothetical protein
LTTRSAIPQRRQNSIVRTETMAPRGRSIEPSAWSMIVQSTPRQASSSARVSPIGPAPTIRTEIIVPSPSAL